MGLVKRKSSFKNAQNAHLDHPAHAQSIIMAFALHSYIPMILLATGKARTENRLCCLRCTHMPEDTFSYDVAQIICNVYHITKTRLYNFDPLKPHFYIVKLGFTGVYFIFLISAQKHRLWVLFRTTSSRRF